MASQHITNHSSNQDISDIDSEQDFSNVALVQEDINVKQINLHHAKSATDLIPIIMLCIWRKQLNEN